MGPHADVVSKPSLVSVRVRWHGPGVVDQRIEPVVPAEHVGGESAAHRPQVGQVEGATSTWPPPDRARTSSRDAVPRAVSRARSSPRVAPLVSATVRPAPIPEVAPVTTITCCRRGWQASARRGSLERSPVGRRQIAGVRGLGTPPPQRPVQQRRVAQPVTQLAFETGDGRQVLRAGDPCAAARRTGGRAAATCMARSATAAAGPSTGASQRTTPAQAWARSPGRRRYHDQRLHRPPIWNTGVRCPAASAPITPAR